ncbi:MAG: indolepyruvate ferredoxin oxidoreductase, partial [Muribaculaceae bacterium]|nr:indolepyruvate ferredoxin oxidoreductase [Muribaculaceae bacterium]
EPSDQQEAYDMARYGFELSEKFHIPVMMRLVTRLSHSRGVVKTVEPILENELSYPAAPRQWVLMPGNSKVRYPQLIEDYAALADASCDSPFNTLSWNSDRSLGIITTGIAYNYLAELFPDGVPFPVLKISQYPLPVDMIRELADATDALMVIEEGQPYVERQLRGLLDRGGKVYGKLDGVLNRTGELTPDRVRQALMSVKPELAATLAVEEPAVSHVAVPRPPALCQGCGHRDVYSALNEVLRQYDSPKVFGDIGCYTLGWLSPFNALDTCVDMGASITMAKGAADAGQHPAVAIIGDSTFTHSGMTGLLDAINENTSMTVIISDNLTTGMTGGQDSSGTGKLEEICRGLGADPAHVRTIDAHPRKHDEMMAMIRSEVDYPGLSVIVSRRECIQTARRHASAKKQ